MVENNPAPDYLAKTNAGSVLPSVSLSSPLVPVDNPNIGDKFLGNLPLILIRLGLSFVFVYAAISMSLDPQGYSHYVPRLIQQIISVEIFLHVFGFFEIVLSLWLLSGKLGLYSAALSALILISLTVSNIDSFNVLFRNVGIIFGALALTNLEYLKRK